MARNLAKGSFTVPQTFRRMSVFGKRQEFSFRGSQWISPSGVEIALARHMTTRTCAPATHVRGYMLHMESLGNFTAGAYRSHTLL